MSDNYQTIQMADAPGVQWIIYFAIFLILLALLAVLFNSIFVVPSTFGTYGPVLIGPCPVTCSENDPNPSSITFTRQNCIPNPETGKGCLVNGLQTFAPRFGVTRCSITCPSSVWIPLNERPCLFYSDPGANPFIDLPITGCIPASEEGIYPISGLIQQCVSSVNPNGPNQCVLQSGLLAPVGFIETIIQPCPVNAPPNPTCGSYISCNETQLVYDYLGGTEVFIATSIPSPYNLLHEGILTQYQTCSVSPGNCLEAPVACRLAPPTPIELENQTITVPQIQTICSDGVNPPACFSLARVFPGSIVGLPNPYNLLINRPCFIVSPLGILVPAFVPINASSPPVPIQWRVFNAPFCSQWELIRTNGLILLFSPDQLGTTRIFAQTNGSALWLQDNQGLPVQDNYLERDLITIAPGALWTSAQPFVFQVVSFTPTIPIPFGAPLGTEGWTINLSMLVQGLPITNATLYLLPRVSSFYDPTINYDSTGNPCFFI